MITLRRVSSFSSIFRKSRRPLIKHISSNNFYPKKLYSTSTSLKLDFDKKINEQFLHNYIKRLENEYEELCKQEGCNSNNRWRQLDPIVQILKERQALVENIVNVKELLHDKDVEIQKLAEEEKVQFENKIQEIDNKLLEALLPVNVEDSSNEIVLEVQAGVGGQEAMLFAKEIFSMYCGFAEYKGWDVQIAEYLITDIGGIRHGTALVSGKSVYQYFKHEAGIHRVQRTPATEKAGRIHTSTVSVVALPQPTAIEVNINPKDLKIETKRSTGAGGQHVNTTDSAVRIVHLPTGTSVECQIDRSQIKNRKMAMARLRAILYQRELDSRVAETAATRKSQVRSRDRNEKIRTYNYNQDRITDHRLQGANVHNLKGFMEGGEDLGDLIEKLEHQERLDSLLHVIDDNT